MSLADGIIAGVGSIFWSGVGKSGLHAAKDAGEGSHPDGEPKGEGLTKGGGAHQRHYKP